MSYLDIALCSLTVLVGATLQGSIGFGMGLFASPILILVDERFVPAPILLSTWVMTTFLIFRERHAIDVGGLRWAVVGRAVGTLAAATLLMFLPRDRMPLMCGIIVLVGVAMSLSGLRFHPSRSVLVGAGAMSAVMGTVASIGGPPIALVYQHGTGARLRATMSSFFWIGTAMSLVVLRVMGRFGKDEVYLTLVILPGVLIGVIASHWTLAVVDRGFVRPVVLTLAAVAGLAVIVRQLI